MKKLDYLLNEIAREEGLFYTTPNYRYFGGKKYGYAFAWTTERAQKDKYWTLKYRILKNGDWKLSKKAQFSKRKTAKDRASKWFAKFKEKK